MPRILRLSLRSFCSSSVSNEPSSTSAPANGSTLKAIGATYFFGSGQRDRARRRGPARGRGRRPRRPARPAPRRPPARCRRPPGRSWRPSGPGRPRRAAACSTGIAAIVVQLGLATMPLRASRSAPGLTSLTTSGTSGSIRQAELLSMTTAPAAANRGASALDVPPPAENSATSRPDVGRGGVLHDDLAAGPRQPWCPPSGPRRRSAARSTGKPRSASSRRITAPTWPVAPTTPTRSPVTGRSRRRPRRPRRPGRRGRTPRAPPAPRSGRRCRGRPPRSGSRRWRSPRR